jgi:hypothetical protein
VRMEKMRKRKVRCVNNPKEVKMKFKLFYIMVLAIFLSYSGALATMREEPSAWWKAESNQANGNLGTSIATGDFNGDGYGDAVAGAWTYNNGEAREGAVFVWYGSDTGFVPDGNPENADWLAESNQASCYFGNSAGTGDFNGDGYDDIIVGAIHYNNGESLEGAAFVWLGSDTGLGPDGNPGNAHWMTESNQEYAQLGVHVNSGDFNADGYDDVIVGSNRYTNGESNEGMVFVWEGSATGLGNNGTPDNADWKAESNRPDAGLGSVASGDFNDDGCDDVLAGALYYANPVAEEGMVFVWEGSAVGFGDDGTPDNADWRGESNQALALIGVSVISGDFNGDGYDDAIVGADNYNNGEYIEGMVFVWEGSAAGLGDNGTPYNADWKAESNQESAYLGYPVGSGDFNGDGCDDIMAGAYFYDNGEIDEGTIFIWKGAITGICQTSNSISHTLRIEPNPVGSGFFWIHYNVFSCEMIPISIALYDLSGRRVKTFLNVSQKKGIYALRCNTNGLLSGSYFLIIRCRDYVKQQKIVVITRQL